MSFKTFCALLFIVLAGAYIYIRVQSMGNDQSAFNQTTRLSLGKNEFARWMFGLHNDGDAREEYLFGTTPILVEVASAPGDVIPDDVLQRFTDQIKKMTGRDAHTYVVDPLPSGSLNDSTIAGLVNVRKRNFEPGSPIILVINADDFDATGYSVGKTFQEYGIVLSTKRLMDLTKYNSATFPEYQLSTLMHEFGHQLGLGHNDQTSCIMNAEVESPAQAGTYADSVTPTEYCPYELDQLQAMKQQLQN